MEDSIITVEQSLRITKTIKSIQKEYIHNRKIIYNLQNNFIPQV